MDLDDYFTVGAGGPFRRNEVFTDREQYVELLARRLEDQVQDRFTVAEFTDFARPARNVVMLHGEGGIGKSTLLRRICQDFLERESPLLPERRAAAVVDFADSANQNFETVVLRLRASLGRVHPRFTCFDTGLAVYWERRHPGVPLREFIDRSGFLGESERSAMGEQISGTLDELLGTMGAVGTGIRLFGSLGHRLAQTTGAHAEGDRHFSALAGAHPLLREAGTWGRAGVALRCSRLAEASVYLPDDQGQPLARARNQDLLGHVLLHSGQFTRSAELFEAMLDHARQVGAPLWAARAARHIALAAMWTNPARVRALLPEARELNEALGDLIGSAQCDLAACLAAVAEGELDRAGQLLESATRRTDESGVVGQLLPVDAVAVAYHLVGGRRDDALSGARRLIADARDACVSPPVWAAVTSLWLDETAPSGTGERSPEDRYDFASIGWYDTADRARTRWRRALRGLVGAV